MDCNFSLHASMHTHLNMIILYKTLFFCYSASSCMHTFMLLKIIIVSISFTFGCNIYGIGVVLQQYSLCP